MAHDSPLRPFYNQMLKDKHLELMDLGCNIAALDLEPLLEDIMAYTEGQVVSAYERARDTALTAKAGGRVRQVR